MKPRNSTPFRSHASITAAFSVALFSHFAAPSASAAILFWDGGTADIAGNGNGVSAGGTGTWNTTIKNWDAGAVPYVAWNNAANDTAEINGGTQTITLGTGVTVGRINQKAGGTSATIAEGTGLNSITLGLPTTIFNNAASTTSGRSLIVNAEVTGSNNLSIVGPTVTPGGNITLGRVNTYTGTTSVNNTTLTISGAGSLNSGNYTNTISLVTAASNFAYGGTSQTLGGVISGLGNLSKSNSNTLALTNTNTYSGTTTITAGNLALTGTGSINSSSGITVNGSSAKLLQTGSVPVSPAVTLTNGTVTGSGTVNTVNVGAATGGIVSNNNGVAGASLTVGNLTFSGAATVNTFGNASAAIITTNLAANVAGLVTINPTAATWTTGSTYDLISYVGVTNPAQFTIGTVTGKAARQTATIGDSGTVITVLIGGTTDFPYWVGTTNSQWDTTTNNNWKLFTATTDTNFIPTDDVLFDDNASGVGPISVSIDAADVATTSTTFNNISRDYVLNSASTFGISAGSLVKNGAGSVTLSTTNTYSGSTTINAGTLRIGAGGTTGTLGSGGVLNNSALVFNRSDLYQVNNVITGTGTVTNAGTAANILDIAANNTYSGGTFINGGGIRLRTDLGGRLGSGTVTVASGANFQIWAPSAVTLTNAIVLNGPTGNAGRPALNQDGGAGKVTLSGPITLNATSDIGIGGTSSNDMEISGQISGPGGMIVDERGLSAANRILTLSSANIYTGPTTLNGGILQLAQVSALGGNNPGVNGTSAITMATGTTLRTNQTNGAFNLYAPITTSGNVTINAPSVSTGLQTFNDLIVRGAIGGTGNVTFDNVVNANTILTVTLNSANTYSGTTTLSNTAGTAGQMFLKLGVENALPTTTILNILGNAGSGTGRGIELNLFGFNQTLAGLTNTAASLRTQRVVNSDVSNAATLTINGSTDTTFSGNLGGGAGFSVGATPIPGSTNGNNFGLTKNGSGKFTLTGNNPFSGATKITAGILSLGNSLALQGSSLDTLNSNAGDPTNGLQTTVTTLTLGGLTGNKNLASVFETTAGGYSTVTALTLNPGTGATPSYSAIIADGAAGMTLTKTGAGTQTLSGANSYTGSTTVTAGTLALGASNALPGTAVLIGNATLDAATFTDTLGTLDATSTAKINLGAGGTLAFAAGSPAWTGTLAITGTFVSGASLKFGTDATGLSAPQLAAISKPGFSGFALNGSGFLTATAVGGYASWAATNASSTTPAQDQDGDGVNNATEYVLGGTVLTNDLSKLPAVSTSGGNLLFTFKRDQASIDGSTIVTIQVGTTLASWPGTYTVGTDTSGSTPGVTVLQGVPVGFDTVTLSVPQAPDAAKFARLNVVVTP